MGILCNIHQKLIKLSKKFMGDTGPFLIKRHTPNTYEFVEKRYDKSLLRRDAIFTFLWQIGCGQQTIKMIKGLKTATHRHL